MLEYLAARDVLNFMYQSEPEVRQHEDIRSVAWSQTFIACYCYVQDYVTKLRLELEALPALDEDPDSYEDGPLFATWSRASWLLADWWGVITQPPATGPNVHLGACELSGWLQPQWKWDKKEDTMSWWRRFEPPWQLLQTQSRA